ncbi:hypothetical protein V8E36_007700 [Tilletia maclaganii]
MVARVIAHVLTLALLVHSTSTSVLRSRPDNGKQKDTRHKGIRQTTKLASILKAPEPLVSLGKALSGSDDPDPIYQPEWAETYALQSTEPPTLVSMELKKTIVKGVQLTGAAYCASITAGDWACGPYCDAFPDFDLTDWGGDGGAIPRYYVSWNPSEQEIVVAHHGADFSHLATLLYTADHLPVAVDPRVAATLRRVSQTPSASARNIIPVGPLAPGTTARSVQSQTSGGATVARAFVNKGFQSAWRKTYPVIKAAVLRHVDAHPDVEKLLVVGHSLGGTVALLDGLALRSVLPTEIPVEVSVTGQPRLGNPVFAALVDALIDDPEQNFSYWHTVSHADVVPHLEPMITGYQHSSHEIWIPRQYSDIETPAYMCPGRENVHCADSVPGTELTTMDHPGAFFGWWIGANCSSTSI